MYMKMLSMSNDYDNCNEVDSIMGLVKLRWNIKSSLRDVDCYDGQ